MGFSTSGSVAVLLIGLFLALSVFVPTLFHVGGSSGEAFSSQSELIREQSNTEISIQSVDTDSGIQLSVSNTGETSLGVRETDLLVNGYYVEPDDTAVEVGDDTRDSTNLWQPGSDLELVVDQQSLPDEVDDVERVQVSTENAIKDSENVGEDDE